jgi:hypothetical protein
MISNVFFRPVENRLEAGRLAGFPIAIPRAVAQHREQMTLRPGRSERDHSAHLY